MTDVKITWKDEKGQEHIERFGEFKYTGAENIVAAIRHCLDDYSRDGQLVYKDIIKVEIEED